MSKRIKSRTIQKARSTVRLTSGHIIITGSPGGHVPLGVVQLQVPPEELARGELLQLEGDVHGDGDEVAVQGGPTGYYSGNCGIQYDFWQMSMMMLYQTAYRILQFHM